MPRGMQGIDYFQSTKPDQLFRDVSLYANLQKGLNKTWSQRLAFFGKPGR